MKASELLDPVARTDPGRIALTDADRSITYGQLAAAVHAESQMLAASRGLRFGLLAENSCAWVISDLALHHLGRLNVPMPACFLPKQLRHLIEDAQLDVLLTDRPEQVKDFVPEFRFAGRSPNTGLALLCRPGSARHAGIPEGVTKITYTSGSTAEPKGVCLSAGALDRVARSLSTVTAPLGIRRHLCLLPLPTLLENLAGIYAPLRSGATCTVLPLSHTGMSYGGIDPERLLRTLSQWQPESLILVPELLRLLVRAAQAGNLLPSTLRFIAVGGAAVSPALLDEAAELGLPVFEGYGLSECASVVCLNTPGSRRIGSVGRALPHAQVRFDARGQVIVRGNTMCGYLGESDSWGRTEIATGDLGSIDEDGFVYIRGRLRNVFISSLGRNVSPEWVERELTQEPVIRHALVCGEAQPFAAALLAPARSEVSLAATAQAVQRANQRLPDYARVHRWALMPETPTFGNGLLTANGRLRRERVLERFGAVLHELFASDPELSKAETS
jgi:long-chain acyl-CoA synthetase